MDKRNISSPRIRNMYDCLPFSRKMRVFLSNIGKIHVLLINIGKMCPFLLENLKIGFSRNNEPQLESEVRNNVSENKYVPKKKQLGNSC